MDASRTTNNNSTSPRAAHGDATAPAAAPPIEQGNSSPSPILYKESPSGFSNFTSNPARVSFGPNNIRPIPPRNGLLGPTTATPPAAAAPPRDRRRRPRRHRRRRRPCHHRSQPACLRLRRRRHGPNGRAGRTCRRRRHHAPPRLRRGHTSDRHGRDDGGNASTSDCRSSASKRS